MLSEIDITHYRSDGYKQPEANDTQHGGDHYRKLDPMPWDVITAWNLGYLDGTALKYIARHRDKGKAEDLKKAIHFLQKALEVYYHD
jgi:hypothetical protein